MGTREQLLIEAGRAEAHYWRDLWRYRELLYFLAWRDILVRYKQTAIGIAWAVIRPLSVMLVFTVVFGKLGKFPSGGVPYPLLVLAAMLPWQFFSNALSESSNSLIGNANLISKVYFPRLIIPLGAVVTSLADFLIAAVLMALLMLAYGMAPGWRVLALPGFLLLALACAVGAGLWFAALNVKYRDFRYIVPFVVQFGLYISPVGFDSAVVPDEWRLLYSMNPMVGVIDGFRWALLGTQAELYLPGLLLSMLVAFAILASGTLYFRRTERSFADAI